MNTLIALLAWCVLLVLRWPLALLALVLWPVAWLLSLAFRVVGITFSALFASCCVADAAGARARLDVEAGRTCERLNPAFAAAHMAATPPHSAPCTRGHLPDWFMSLHVSLTILSFVAHMPTCIVTPVGNGTAGSPRRNSKEHE